MAADKKDSCKDFQNIISKALTSREENFARIQSILDENEGKFDPNIVKLAFIELRDRLQSDRLTPKQVLLAFQKHALAAQKATNCIIEFLIEESFEIADDLARKFYKNGLKKPYLYGIPISMKESFTFKGHDSTSGLCQYVNQPSPVDGVFVRQMKHLGAIPFARTNVPYTMMSVGSSNPIYGATKNPYDITRGHGAIARTPGGSTSGEAALLAMGGSPLGVGSDIGGSVRVPANFCGICSLKPTVGRLSQRGQKCCFIGMEAIKATAGFMGPSVQSLECAYRGMWSNFEDDADVIPLPFQEFHPKTPLRIGFYETDNFVDPVPACRRALKEACDILRKAGHTLVQFNYLDEQQIHEFVTLYKMLIFPDNAQHLQNVLSKDVFDPVHDATWFKDIPIKGITETKVRDVLHFQMLLDRMVSFRDAFFNEWQHQKLDCIICPVSAMQQPPIGQIEKAFHWSWTYTSLYNLLNCPAGVVPITLANDEDEKQLSEYGTKLDNYMDANLHHIVREMSKGAVGYPVGVQVVCLPFKDEMCLQIMKILQDAAGLFKPKL